MSKFSDIFIDVTKHGRKLPTSEYKQTGKHPIIDQGQRYIAGYTDEDEGLFTDVPVIIFGDHTRVIKYVDIPFFLGADGAKILKAKEESANNKFLFYALLSAHLPNTGYNRHFKWLKEVEIPECSVEAQYHIVSVFDKIDKLIKDRNQQIAKLEELIKSQFIEMFGDPEKNPFGWDVMSLKDIAVGKLAYGSGVAATDYDGCTRYVRITDINENGELTNDYKSPQFVDENYILNDGDILFARTGATVGKTFLYNASYGRCIYAGFLIRLIPDLAKVNPKYVFTFTKSDYYKKFVSSTRRVVAQPNINAQEYGELKICIPPIELQNRFATFVEQTDKLKLEVKESLEKLETLKKSLMQKYFG